jgi:pilus assembly protein CpaC
MLLTSPYRTAVSWPKFPGCLVFALLLGSLAITGQAAAEQPACPPTISGFAPCLPPTPQRPPRPATGPESVAAFVDHLTTNDSAFEVVMGQGRILSIKAKLKEDSWIAAGDPSVIDFSVVSPRQIRVIGQRIGVTDLSITTSAGESYNFEIRVVADLNNLRSQLACMFPDAQLRLGQIRDHIVVGGQARDTGQVARIIETIRAYLLSLQNSQARRIGGQASGGRGGDRIPTTDGEQPPAPGETGLPGSPRALQVQGTVTPPQIINLIRVPGTQQVLLKVRVAELNRTGLRQIGGDFLAIDSDTGAIVGTQIGGTGVTATALATGRLLTGSAQNITTATTTLFGIFQEGDFAAFLSALRRNSLLKILAEPNLVAMNGHQASFLAGGEFPVPVPQTSSGGAAPAITVQFQPFGVRLNFVPYILDNDVIRLSVDPEVSTVDFALGTTLVPGGSPVPGLDIRNAHTVVELRQGQTLAIAGLMQLTVDAQTSRIPGLGDLPIIGPFFSNTTNTRTEKELVVLVTPVLVEPMNRGQVPPGPGDEVNEPNDLEFYLLNRIESRTGRDHRSTTQYDDPLHVVRCFMKLANDHIQGPHGHCD